MKKKLLITIMAMVLCLILAPAAFAEGASDLTVSTMSGDYGFNVGDEFTYYYWLQVSADYINYTSDQIADAAKDSADDSAVLTALLTQTDALKTAKLKNIVGAVYFDTEHLELVKAEMPNLSKGVAADLSTASSTVREAIGADNGRTGAYFACFIFSEEEATQFDTETKVLVKCTFRVKSADDEKAYIRTRLGVLKVSAQVNGVEKTFYLVNKSKAFFAYESYDTINDEKPTVMLKSLVADQAFDVKCIVSAGAEDDFIHPDIGVEVNMMGATTYGRYEKYTSYTPDDGIVWFYDIEYGTYYVNCGWVSINGQKYSTKDPAHAEVVNIPTTGSVQDLWLFLEDEDEVRDVKVLIKWEGDNDYLPARPSMLTATLYNPDNDDTISTLYADREDEEITFYYVEKKNLNGSDMNFAVKMEPTVGTYPYTFTTEHIEGEEEDDDYFIVTGTYTGSEDGLDIIVPDAHGHYWQAIEAGSEATCTEGGTQYSRCIICNAVKHEEVEALGHNFVNYIYNNNATCETAGTMTAKCTRCTATDTKNDPDHPARGHLFSEWVRSGDATCDYAGHDKRTCTRPGCTKEETRDSEFGKLGHLWSNWEEETPATCEKDGTLSRHCTRKGCTAEPEVKTNVGSALGHSYGAWQIVTPATCTEDAVREHKCQRTGCTKTEKETVKDSALGHSWSEWEVKTAAACETDTVEQRHCKRCDVKPETRTVTGTALGHLLGDYIYNNDATCEKDGTATAQCTRTDCEYTDTIDVEGTALGHDWGPWVSNGDATDTADGTKTRRCQRDGCSADETVADVGSCTCHHYGEYVSDNNATCYSCGTKTAACTDEGCEATHTVDDPENQPKTDHDWTAWTECGDKTCTYAGTQEHHCQFDGCTASEKRINPAGAPGHTWGTWSADGNATCTYDGTHTRQCTVEGCGVKQTEVNNGGALGHDYGEYVYNNDATCYADGTESKTCQRDGCGYVYTHTKTGTKREHSWGTWTSDNNATCTSNGTQTRYCQYDGCTGSETKDAYTGKLGHLYVDYTYNNDATCEKDGTETAVCQRDGCGQKDTRTKTNSKLGHDWSDYVYNNNATCQNDGTKTRTCKRIGCGETETVTALNTKVNHSYVNGYCIMCKQPQSQTASYTLTLTDAMLHGGKEVYIDGVKYTADANGKITLDNANAKTAIVYTYNKTDMSDMHTVYPTHMYVYTLTLTSRTYTAVAHTALTDILQYAGSSIRVKGVKGIRMITGIPSSTRSQLINSSVDGYTLQEYGTIVAWDSDLNGASLTRSNCKAGNYAYSRANGTDPIFADTGSLIQYTNVLTNISNEKCVNDLSMRTYMVLKDTKGNEITLYGGTIHRSIGYIAYQNRNAFTPGSDAYNYVWDIIHYVYGTKYDSEYKG